MLAGIAGATHSTAHAYIADISPPEKRAQNFGLIGAAFGIGFILGPIVGGLAGELGPRQPFFAAAAVAFVNLVYGYFLVPESLVQEKRRPFSVTRANPLGVARQIRKFPTVAWLFAAVFLYNVAHFVYPAVWSFYTKEALGWTSAEVGLSLAAVGVGFAVVQGWLIRLVLPRLGEAKTAVLGFLVSIAGLVGLAFANVTWLVYSLMPFVALGAMVTPAMTGLMSNRIPDDAQGELQGALTSVAGVTIIISPVLMTQLFGYFAGDQAPFYFPGAPFLAAAVLMSLALIPFGVGLQRAPAVATEGSE